MRSWTLIEYGSHADTARGARAFFSATRPRLHVDTPALYVGVVRRMARDWHPQVVGEGRIDGRLVAIGFRRVGPRRWLDSELARFVAYWEASQPRPGLVGSSHNDGPGHVYRAMRAGIPASMLRAVGVTLAVPDPQLRGRTLPRADRVPRRRFVRVARAAVALRRTSAGGRRDEGTLKFWAALGRLCPELQRAVLEALPRDYRAQPYTQRDIPWEIVARRQAQLRADPTGKVRVALAACGREGGRRAKDLAGASWWCLADMLAPAYPRVPLRIARRLALGESPRDLSDGQLTAAEAHRWLRERPGASALEWYCDAYHLPALRSWAIARWAAARVAHPESRDALMLERSIRGPAGQTAIVRYWDRLDEIQDCDLDRGPKTGVQRAFERAAERFGEAWLTEHREDHRVLCDRPGWLRESSRVRLLRTAAELIREGECMEHCVGSYADAVAKGQCVIVSVRAPFGLRSTLELTPDGQVLQHRGPRNADPPPACLRVLTRALGVP